MLFILSGSSGAGKNTIIKQIIDDNKDMKIMKSCTTRQPRNKDEKTIYYFLTKEEFEKKIENNEFFEYQEVHEGIYYGVLKKSLQEIEKNKAYFKDIDVLGAIAIKKFAKNSVRLVFLDVDKDELFKRLITRGENIESANKRLARYEFEKSFINDYDLIIKNTNQEDAKKKILDFIKNELDKKI